MDVRLPDGTIVSNVSEGITQSDLMARVAKSRQPTTPQADTAEQIAGNPLTRFAMGAASPIIGLAQLATNTGLTPDTGKAVNEHLAQLEAMKNRGMEASDNGGTDWMGLAGTVASPVGLAATKAIPAATSLMGKLGQGASIGAGYGAATPVTDGGQNFGMEKAGQVGAGALTGGLVTGGVQAAKGLGRGIGSAVESATEKGRANILDRFQKGLAGDKRQAIIQALQQAKEIVPGSKPTAGEAISSIPESTALAAHQKAIAKSPVVSGQFEVRADAQEAARKAALGQIAQTPEALAAAIKERGSNAAQNYGAVENMRVNPSSDVQIMQGAIDKAAASKGEALRDWGRFATTQAENETRGANWYPVSGMPRVSGRASNFPERAAEAGSAATDAAGIAAHRQAQANYLENAMESLKNTVGLDAKSLNDFVSRPSMRSAMNDALLSSQERGTYFPAGKGEQFSVANLQRIKESLDAGIAAAKRSTDAGHRPELSPAELEGTRRQFISWLSNKVPGWADARQQFASDSKPINQMHIGQYLQDKLGAPLGGSERAAAYAQALRDAPGTIKRSTGTAIYDKLGKVLEPGQEEAATSVGADLARQAQYGQRAAGTNLSGVSNVAEAAQPRLPNLLSRPAMILNAVMKHLGYNAEDKINKLAGERYLNPQALADALKDVPAPQRGMVKALIMQLRDPALIGAPATLSAQQGQQ